MSIIGRTVVIRGEVHSLEDLTLEGRVDGPITCEDCAISLAESGQVHGRVIARDITVFGRADGQLIATDVVDVRPGAHVNGQVNSPRFILHDAARFDGRVEPQHLEAALRVAKFKQRERAS
jgi:cytoskeletal protein CcmA (bactofilin family)